MKKIAFVLVIVFAFTALSCEGDRGPQGPPGLDGGLEFATVYEIERDLIPEQGYNFIFEFPGGPIPESDVVQVFLSEDRINGSDLWTPLPASFFFEDSSELVYNYNHTEFDVEVFLTDSNSSLNTVPDEFIFNRRYRIVVIPAAFGETTLNLNSMEAIMQAMPNSEIINLN